MMGSSPTRIMVRKKLLDTFDFSINSETTATISTPKLITATTAVSRVAKYSLVSHKMRNMAASLINASEM